MNDYVTTKQLRRWCVLAVLYLSIIGTVWIGFNYWAYESREKAVYFVITVIPLGTSSSGYDYQLIGNVSITDPHSSCGNCAMGWQGYPSSCMFLEESAFRPVYGPELGHTYNITFSSGHFSDSVTYTFKSTTDFEWFRTPHFFIKLETVQGHVTCGG